jgi:hypothetical protein
MELNVDLLVQEADRLVERTGRQLRLCSSKLEDADCGARDRHAMEVRVHCLRLRLQRLELYRSVVKNPRSSHALLPEFLLSCGLLPREHEGRGLRRGRRTRRAAFDQQHERPHGIGL